MKTLHVIGIAAASLLFSAPATVRAEEPHRTVAPSGSRGSFGHSGVNPTAARPAPTGVQPAGRLGNRPTYTGANNDHGRWDHHRGWNGGRRYYGGYYDDGFYYGSGLGIGLGLYGASYYPYEPGYGYGYGPGYGYGYGGAYYSVPPTVIYQGNPAGSNNGSVVTQVQRRLARAGYYKGAIDGVIGAGTRRAIRNYERDHRLPVDGQIDEQLLEQLGV